MPLENPFWPYVKGIHSTERDTHIWLKSLAVLFLLQRGFDLDDIQEEYTVHPTKSNQSNPGYTDVYADDGDREVYVECETSYSASHNDLSQGGLIPARQGKDVYIVHPGGIDRVTQVTEMVEKMGLGLQGEEYETGEYIDDTHFEFERVAEFEEST